LKFKNSFCSNVVLVQFPYFLLIIVTSYNLLTLHPLEGGFGFYSKFGQIAIQGKGHVDMFEICMFSSLINSLQFCKRVFSLQESSLYSVILPKFVEEKQLIFGGCRKD